MGEMAFDSIPEPGDPIRLGEFFLEDRRFSAVYFLYSRGEVVYVGQSRTLKARIDGHLTEDVKLFDAVAFIRCTVDRLTKIESHYIRQLAPKYNDCAIARKVRERESWQRECSRYRARRSKFSAPSSTDPRAEAEFVLASESIIEDGDIGEFMQVSDRDAARWLDEGKIADKSVLGLLYFVAANHREVGAAQERFENL